MNVNTFAKFASTPRYEVPLRGWASHCQRRVPTPRRGALLGLLVTALAACGGSGQDSAEGLGKTGNGGVPPAGDGSASLTGGSGACGSSEVVDGLQIKVGLTLSTDAVSPGQTLTGAATLYNPTGAAIVLEGIDVAARPPGGTNSGGPYDDLYDGAGITIAAGQTYQLKGGRPITAADPTGTWYAYLTLEDASGTFHDSHCDVSFAVEPSKPGAATTTPDSGTNVPEAGAPTTGTFGVKVSGHNIVDGNGTPIQLRGVNISGMEGTPYNSDPWHGQAPNWAAIKSWGTNVVRIPLAEANWLGLCNTSLNNGITPAVYQAAVAVAVNECRSLGIYVIIDLHIVAVPSLCPNGQNPMADAQYSPTFWTQVANAYKNNPGVLFEIFNEPQGNYPPTTADWNNYVNGKLASSTDTNTQTLLNAIRATGATNVVLVDTLDYASTFGNNNNQNLRDNPPGFTLPTDSLPVAQLVAVRHFYNSANQYNTGAEVVLNKGIPILITEYGDEDGTTNDTNAVFAWADKGGGASKALTTPDPKFPGIGYVAWTWNYGYGGWSLISNSSGALSGSPYAAAVKAHYQALAGM